MDVLGKEPTFFSRLNGLFKGILSFKSLFENTYINNMSNLKMFNH